MRVDEDKLRTWIRNCDPHAPLDPTDSRYLNLGEVSVGGESVCVRGEDAVAALTDAIELSDRSSCQLFSGFIGTGKSTELRRLKTDLEAYGYVVLLADAQNYHDLNHPLAIEDLLVILAGSFGEAAAQHLGPDLPETSYWHKLQEFLRKDVELKDIQIPAGAADLKLGVSHAQPFWLKVRETLALSLGKLQDHSHRYVRGCVARIERVHRPVRGVVFVLDTLEKLRGPETEFRQMMESVVRVLSDYPGFLRLPDCHVIYTVPPYAQMISPGLGEHYDRVSQVLPAVKVLEPGSQDRPFAAGVEAMISLIGRRIPIAEVFGERRDLLEVLVLSSGGHVRTLISFLKELLFRARRNGLPPTEAEVQRVVQPFRERARMAIWRESALLLHRVLTAGTVEGIREEEYAILARLMDNSIVLSYRNGEGRYEVHPLVRDHVVALSREINGESG